jgi:hypothetical protein
MLASFFAVRVASLSLFLVAVAAYAPGAGAALGETPRLVFVTPASDLLQDSPLLVGEPGDAGIVVTMPGMLWPESLTVPDAPWPWPPDPGVVEIDSMLANLRAAALSGDAGRLAMTFVPEERAAARTRFANSAVLANARYEAGAEGTMRAFGWASYGEFVLALVTIEADIETLRRVLVFAERHGEGWLRTDALEADAQFQVVWSAWLDAGDYASAVTMIPSDFDPFPPE